MNRNFSEWLSTFKDSIADWKYYTDFDKVYKNVNRIKIELNLLNSLINSKDIENDFRSLVKQYPNVLSAVPYLIAKREIDKQSKIQIVTANGLKEFNFDKPNYSLDEYVEFLDKTGIFDLLSKHIISDLTDYVRGVEVGLDTNARKNRTGTAMENLVESFLLEYGFKKNSTYFKEMYASDILHHFGVDVTTVDKKKKANKRFDFVVKTSRCVYGIEVNFYSGGGLN